MPLSTRHDLTAAIARQADLEVVGRTGCRGVALLMEARRVTPDAVVLGGEDGELPGLISQLLSEFPTVAAVAVITGDPPDVCLAIRRAFSPGHGPKRELLEVIRSVLGAPAACSRSRNSLRET